MMDYYTHTLTKVLGNEKDAQVCIYDISRAKDFGFCCQINEPCARVLADVPGVLSVQPNMNFGSCNKGYKAFEGFGELIEVEIIIDKISKRSKVYAFIGYTPEEAASAVLKDMNRKVFSNPIPCYSYTQACLEDYDPSSFDVCNPSTSG
ncbi:organelle RRM domain-containing protein 1, chloroplastic-like isoform X2 [Phoenix dactylifera]|uniref:Organelle RRM domain-containing protein 1, chloroplastic-like isoform X2 n=1 Tax=Phoenix dactylifera TaxID=42345 RepID=A0A8B7MW17_PHODC|nr:organelle RRM domain-containing protein 1, chloroplastic-like isoform X2 [Phoenix dactylifera]